MGAHKLEIGQFVYHREIYNHRERMKIVGLRQNEVELEGDYSGGTNNVCQKQWMPIKGTSRIYDHGRKQEFRNSAITMMELAKPIGQPKDNMTKSMFDLNDMVMILTTDISYNPEF